MKRYLVAIDRIHEGADGLIRWSQKEGAMPALHVVDADDEESAIKAAVAEWDPERASRGFKRQPFSRAKLDRLRDPSISYPDFGVIVREMPLAETYDPPKQKWSDPNLFFSGPFKTYTFTR